MQNKTNTHILLPAITVLFSAFILAACSEKETIPTDPLVPNDTEEILFGGAVKDSQEQQTGTRAADLETVSTTFKVYGYKNTAYDAGTDAYSGLQTVFNGYTVMYQAGTAGTTPSNRFDWEYVNGTTQTVHYWDFSAKAYRFAGYAPADAAVTKTETDAELKLSISADARTLTGIENTPYYAKEWFSNNNFPAYTAYGSPVTLTFMQPLTKVRIMFVNEDGTPVTASDIVYQKTTAGSIKFQPADASKAIAVNGTVNVSYPLTGTDNTETLSITAGTAAGDNIAAITEPYEDALAFASELHKWYTVLPMGAQGSYNISLEYNGQPRSTAVSAEYMEWQAGYQYTYVFKLTDKGLTFMPQLYVYTKWQAGYADNTKW
jgi:hypothetical protein